MYKQFLQYAFFILTLSLVNTMVQAKELWVYTQVNLLVPQEVNRLIGLMERASKVGYTHFLLADSKFSRLSELDQRYFDHIEQVQKRAQELNLTLVPAICSVGYSNDILSLNPNLAEGLPVRDCLYRVQDGYARCVSELESGLPNLADRNKWTFIDDSLKLEDNVLHSKPPHSDNVRLSKKLKLKPNRHYHVSVRVKTDGLNTPVEIKVLTGNGRSLNHTNLGTKPTQDWQEHHITFNSLENAEAAIYIGAWGPDKGELWIAEPKIEECGAVNLLRRETTPIIVQQILESGERRRLQESVDFEKWSDPKLGTVPYAGEYEVWHSAPPIKLKKPLANGTELRVSYYHTHIVYDGQVCAAANDQEFQNLLDDQISRMTKLFPEADFMMSHDEYRVMGWTDSNITELPPGSTPADVLTHNAKHCSEQIRANSAKGRILVWSDMFDPYHNAVDNYYLVNGSLKGATVPREVMVVNWNFGKRAESLKHFAQLGHLQVIAGYYDAPPDQITRWLDTVIEQKINTVDGVMYTTWNRNFSDLEEFARIVKGHDWYTQN
jgi:hypothetical protein